ncbi:MAG: YtxH domain-containing protein [Bacillus sp. (in: Bacteria)]|nr:YtxH domain-containing protein [Bacillus sp. (in: firmicutes)]
MKQEKRFVKGVLWGALVGGVLTLLDEDTRKAVWSKTKDGYQGVQQFLKNPNEKIEKVMQVYNDYREQFEIIKNDVEQMVNQLKEQTQPLKEVSASNEEQKEE